MTSCRPCSSSVGRPSSRPRSGRGRAGAGRSRRCGPPSAMREIGARWKAGSCDIGQEHFATDVVQGWLARRTASYAVSTHAAPRSCSRAVERSPRSASRRSNSSSRTVRGRRGPGGDDADQVARRRRPRGPRSSGGGDGATERDESGAIASVEAVAAIPECGGVLRRERLRESRGPTADPGVFLGGDVVAGADRLVGDAPERRRR